MPFTDYAQHKANILNPHQIVRAGRMCNTPAIAFFSGWIGATAGNQGVAPTTAVAPDNTTLGAINGLGAAINQMRLIKVSAQAHVSAAIPCGAGWIVIDRLSHQGGLVGNVGTPQTTNLPTAALTRYTDAVGVMAAIEVYTVASNTASVMTISYTNEAGVAGRTGYAASRTTMSTVNSMLIFSLQAGDKGVKSVESFTMGTAMAVAGNLGITLFKPLLIFPGSVVQEQTDALMLGCMPVIKPTSCLSVMCKPAGFGGFVISAEFKLAEEP
jgi:hypothetical protein